MYTHTHLSDVIEILVTAVKSLHIFQKQRHVFVFRMQQLKYERVNFILQLLVRAYNCIYIQTYVLYISMQCAYFINKITIAIVCMN